MSLKPQILSFYGRIPDINKCLEISVNAKKNKQGCTLREMEKPGVAVDGIGSNTASIIDVMAIVQRMIVESKTLSVIANSVSQEFLLILNKINALMRGMKMDRFCPATTKMNMGKNSVAIG